MNSSVMDTGPEVNLLWHRKKLPLLQTSLVHHNYIHIAMLPSVTYSSD